MRVESRNDRISLFLSHTRLIMVVYAMPCKTICSFGKKTQDIEIESQESNVEKTFCPEILFKPLVFLDITFYSCTSNSLKK